MELEKKCRFKLRSMLKADKTIIEWGCIIRPCWLNRMRDLYVEPLHAWKTQTFSNKRKKKITRNLCTLNRSQGSEPIMKSFISSSLTLISSRQTQHIRWFLRFSELHLNEWSSSAEIKSCNVPTKKATKPNYGKRKLHHRLVDMKDGFWKEDTFLFRSGSRTTIDIYWIDWHAI